MAARNLSSEPDSPQSERADAESVIKQAMPEMRCLNGLTLQNLIEVMCLFIISIPWHPINIGIIVILTVVGKI